MPTENPFTLKPGFLVALSTEIHGGVEYVRKDLDVAEASGDIIAQAAADAPAAAQKERWESLKITDDPEEHAKAVQVRGRARALVTAACVTTPFGYLCPKDKLPLLDVAIATAKAAVDGFNATAKVTRIGLWTMKGQIVESDTDAARGIAVEVKSLLDAMDSGIKARDAEAIREAVKKAKAIGTMLDEGWSGVVTGAIEEARKAAREITRVVRDRGEEAQTMILACDATEALEKLTSARLAFLDLSADLAAPTAGEELPATIARGLELDDDDDDDEPAVEASPALVLDLGDVDAAEAVSADAAYFDALDVGEMAAGSREPGDSGPEMVL